MLLTIHNLPAHMQYPDIKQLLFTKCGLTELIVDNLVNEGNGKKVTIGVTRDNEAAIVMRTLNGLFIGRQQLYVEDVRHNMDQNLMGFQPNNPVVWGDNQHQPTGSWLPEPVAYHSEYYQQSNRFETFNERPQDRPHTKNRRPDLKRKASGPAAKRLTKKKIKNTIIIVDPALRAKKMNNQEKSFRGTAISNVVKEIKNNHSVTPTQVLELKAALWKRIDLLLGTNYHDSPVTVLENYRKAYPISGDGKLLEELEKVPAAAPPTDPIKVAANGDQLLKDPAPEPGSSKPTADTTNEPAKITNIPGIPELNKPKLQKDKVLPPHPYGKSKKLKEEEIEDIMKSIDEVTSAIMDERLSAIFATIRQGLPQPKNEMQTTAYNYILEEMSQEFVEAVKLLCIRRMQNVKTYLPLRVIGMPRLPNVKAMSNYLKRFNVVSLKVAVKRKVYVATLTSYEDYDRLIALKKPKIAGAPVMFKALNKSGLMKRLKKKEHMKAVLTRGYGAAGSQDTAQQGQNVIETEPHPNDQTFPGDESLLDDEELLPGEELFPDNEPDINDESNDELIDEYDIMNDTVEDIPEALLNVNNDELEDYSID